MTLRHAHVEIAGDWIAAYKRHFATSVPLRDYAQSPLTAADAPALRAELAEFGIAAPRGADGAVLLALLERAQEGSAAAFAMPAAAPIAVVARWPPQ